MIVVDTSAILAIILQETEADTFRKVLEENASTSRMSAVNAYETAIVLRMRQGDAAVEAFWHLMALTAFEIVPFDDAQLRSALTAYARYGKGIDPRARLNLCDCAAYALARTLHAPLLFKGEDFSHTDVARCM